MKLKVQAQHLQPGDIVGSGDKIIATLCNAVNLPTAKIYVKIMHRDGIRERVATWGKYTEINIERE